MSATEQAGYTLDPGLGLEPIAPGTNLLVTGPALSGTSEVLHRLLACDRDGVLFVSTDDSPEDHVSAYERVGGVFDRNRMGLVCCSETLIDPGESNVKVVSSPSDLTGVGMQWSGLYQELAAAGVDRVRTGIDTLSTMLTYAGEVQPVFRFLHTVTGRISTAGGIGAAAVDPAAQDDAVLSSIAQCFDGRIEVRADESGTDREIRAVGLPDQPDGWHPVA